MEREEYGSSSFGGESSSGDPGTSSPTSGQDSQQQSINSSNGLPLYQLNKMLVSVGGHHVEDKLPRFRSSIDSKKDQVKRNKQIAKKEQATV